MNLFHEYELASRRGPSNVRQAQNIGKVAIFLIGVVVFAWPGSKPPALWLLLGNGIGLYLVVRGSRDLVFTTGVRSRIGQRLARTTDRWFPPLMFMSVQIYVALAAASIWMTMVEFGFPARPLEHALVLSLIGLIPLKRLVSRLVDHQSTRPRILLNELVNTALVALATGLTVDLIYLFNYPDDTARTGEMNYAILVLWVFASLVIMGQFLWALSRMIRKNPYEP